MYTSIFCCLLYRIEYCRIIDNTLFKSKCDIFLNEIFLWNIGNITVQHLKRIVCYRSAIQKNHSFFTVIYTQKQVGK